MKKHIKTWINMCVILICGGIIGILLLGLVYCIPTDKAYARYRSIGLDMIEGREGWHRYLTDYGASTLDNVTENEMLRIASSPLPKETGENVFQYAMRAYQVMTYLDNEWYEPYERYWHGYLVILKPLLHFFSYTDIVFINMAIQAILMFAVLHILMKNKSYSLQMIFVLFWILTMQVIIMFSMDYSVCFYIYMFGTLAVLLCDKVRKNYIYTFLIIGMLTSYMDFLTWPLVTLVMPLIVLLYVERKQLISVLMASISWGIGYGVFWAEKWILGSMILKHSIMQDALEQIMVRSSIKVVNEEFDTSFWETLETNFSVFQNKGYFVILLIAFGGVLILQLFRIYKGEKVKIKESAKYLVLSLLPLGWYMVTTNHATIHYWMTWRTAAVFIIIIFTTLVEGVGIAFDKRNSMEG